MSQPQLNTWVASLVAREVARDAARRFARASIPVIPLKGVYLQRVVYPDPAERPLVDVDMLVPPSSFQRACRLLRNDGLRASPCPTNPNEIAFRGAWPLPLDLHKELFAPYRFRLGSAEMFRRATPDQELFGVPIMIACPYDLYAHSVGHFACDHLAPHRSSGLRDLELIARHFELSPRRCAEHLDLHGLARAARYTLGFCWHRRRDAFARRVLECLPADPIGERIAAAATRFVTRLARPSPIGALGAHMLNVSLATGACSFIVAFGYRIRGAVRAHSSSA